MDVLSINDLSIQLAGGSELVKGINLKIKKGEIHGLIGESGSGKSLTAASIVRLLPGNLKMNKGSIDLSLDSGHYSISDIDTRELLKLRGKEVGFVFQDPMTCLNPSVKCGKQVAEVLSEHTDLSRNERKSEVLRLFEKVELPNIEKIYRSYPHEISGGQRQRVMIAMAVACKPKLLIADEITTALDVTVQKSIIELINELRQSEGLAVLFITHDLGLIAEYADSISIMYKGELVEHGDRDQIIKRPQHAYTKGLLACKPPLDKKLERLPSLQEVLEKGEFKSSLGSLHNREEYDTLLEVKGLNIFYTLKKNLLGKVVSEMHAIKNASFEVKERDSLAIVGESGSGKSTLGKTILGLLESKNGTIKYRGESLGNLSKKDYKKYRKKIQFIFQDPFSSLNPKMLIGQSIAEPMKVHGIGKSDAERLDRTKELLVKVGLSESDYKKYPHQFSGGQRQRIVIARALSVEPEFIVCDEAVSALDVSVQAMILNLLKDLQEEFNLTYFFITHDMSVVRFLCNRMIVFKEGEMIEQGDVETVFKNPSQEFTKELIEASR